MKRRTRAIRFLLSFSWSDAGACLLLGPQHDPNVPTLPTIFSAPLYTGVRVDLGEKLIRHDAMFSSSPFLSFNR